MMLCRCGCCEGIHAITPVGIVNRPGLPAIGYRVGTHAAFLATMEARLSQVPPLTRLTTRSLSDGAMAVLDGWATIADVLTFYQERLANEGYLRTAVERRSVMELARLIGYSLRPGVASSVYLAFTLEAGYDALIPAGTQATSLPAQGQLPQPFETSDPLSARSVWNWLRPRLTRPQLITETRLGGLGGLYFKGIDLGLKANEPLLVLLATPAPVWVLTAEAQPEHNWTHVTLKGAAVSGSSNAARTMAFVRILIDHLTGEQWGVNSTSTTAQTWIKLFNEQIRQVSAVADADAAAYVEKEVLPVLQKQFDATLSTYTNLRAWMQDLIDKLRTELTQAALASPPTAPPTPPPPPQPGGGQPPVGRASVEAILSALEVPASVAPASRLRLARDAATAFGPGSDTLIATLVKLHPRLAGNLQVALGSITFGSPDGPVAITALPVTAPVFGHNAPLKPILDGNGVTVGSEEWPLMDAVGYSVALLTYLGELTPPPDLEIEVTSGGSSQKALVRLAADTQQTISLRGLAVDVTPTGAPSPTKLVIKVHAIADKGADRTLTLTIDGAAGSVKGQIDNEQASTLTSGQSSTYVNAGRAVVMSRAYDVVKGADRFLVTDFSGALDRRVVILDAVYDTLKPGDHALIQRPSKKRNTIIASIIDVASVSVAAYSLTGRVTKLTLDQDWLDPGDLMLSDVRDTTVYAGDEPLTLADEPIDSVAEPVEGDQIELDGFYPGLEAGRWLIVTGERLDVPGATGVIGTELAMLAGVRFGAEGAGVVRAPAVGGDFRRTFSDFGGAPGDLRGTPGEFVGPPGDLPRQPGSNGVRPGERLHTILLLANKLAYVYKRDTVRIYANVVHATHGETRKEVLGSGDGSKALQTFALKHSPLTYVSDSNPAGVSSTLQVRVDELLWHESPGIAWLGPRDRGYITQTDDADVTGAVFGDGIHGARLTTGVENVIAVYRDGIGKPGNQDAGRISLLTAKPLGVKEVINPLPATGGADHEDRDSARANAPLAVMALDRLVSIRDYEDFSRTFAGIGKAAASRLTDGRRELVHVTVAGADDIPIAVTSDLFKNLQAALRQFGDPFEPVQLALRDFVMLVISAKVRVLPDFSWQYVEPKVRASLLERLGFGRRPLARGVARSEVIAAIQSVPGVAYVDLDVFDGVAESASFSKFGQLAPTLNDKVDALPARLDAGSLLPAQLVYLSPAVPDTLLLSEVTTS